MPGRLAKTMEIHPSAQAAKNTLLGLSRASVLAILMFAPLARGGVPFFAKTGIELLAFSGICFLVMARALAWEGRIIRTPLGPVWASLLALCLLSSVFSVNPSESFSATLLFASYLALYGLIVQEFRTRAQVLLLTRVLVWTGCFLALFGILKGAGLNPFFFWDYGERQAPYLLASGTYRNSNHLAGHLSMTLFLALGLAMGLRVRRERALTLAAAGVMAFALVFTHSRGGLVGLAAGGLFFVIAGRAAGMVTGRRILVGAGLFLLAFLLMVLLSEPLTRTLASFGQAGEAVSFHNRIVAWKGVLAVIREYPVLGSGTGTFASVFPGFQPPGLARRFFYAHNDYLQLVSELGLAVIPLLLWGGVVFFRRGIAHLYEESRLARGLCVGALSGIVTLLVHAAFDFNLRIPGNAVTAMALAAPVMMVPGHRGFRRVKVRRSALKDEIPAEPTD